MTLHRLAAPILSLAITILLATGAHAQGIGLFQGGVSQYTETIQTQGCCVRVERYQPSCGGNFPAVILLHGSGGVEAYAREYRATARMLAASGYVAILPHYQAVTGVTPAEGPIQIDPAKFIVWMRTVSDVFRYTASQPCVDSSRIGIAGFSLGAYVAVAFGAMNPQIKAVVELFGGIPAPIARQIRRMPPTLIIHGEADTTVPVTEAYKLASLLQSKKAYYEIQIYPSEGHLLSDAPRQVALQRAFCFLEQHLK